MKKIYIWLMSLLWIFQGISIASTVTVTDQAGRQVRITQPVNRVVTTFIPATIFALCADLGDALVGASNQDGTAAIYDALIDHEKPPVLVGNRTAGISLETIFSLKPDLVIMYGQKDGVRLADRLTSMGIPAIVIMPESLGRIRQALDLLGRASGKKAHADRVITAMTRIETMMAKTLDSRERHSVYYAASRLLSTVSGDMLQNEMIRIAGGYNVSQNTNGFFVTVSREQLISWNPEVIITSNRVSPEAQAALGSMEFDMIQAVKNKKIFKVPAETYWDFPSPLALAGVLWMAGKIHPDAFPDPMVRAEIQALYDTVFGEGFSRDYPKVVGNAGGR